MEPISTALAPFIPHLLPLFVEMLKDTEDDVRNNAIYGLGELVLWAGELRSPPCPTTPPSSPTSPSCSVTSPALGWSTRSSALSLGS
jgi:hypothetical protein